MPIDPVCKMHVDVPTASQDYYSMTLYFCTLDCQKEFKKDPKKVCAA